MKSFIQHSKTIPFIALVLGTIALAGVPIFMRLSALSPASLTFWRMTLSVPILGLAWMLLPAPKKEPLPLSLRDYAKYYLILVVAGLFFAGDLVCLGFALELTSVANGSMLVNFASLFVALFSWLILRQAPSKGLMVGMFIAIGGSILLIWPHLDALDDSLVGDALSLVAAAFYALYLIAVQIARRTFGTISIMMITGIVTSLGGAWMAWMLGETLMVDTLAAWLALVGLAFIGQTLGQGFIAFALLEISATLSSIVLLSGPVIAALIAWVLFDEHLVIMQMAGMVMILVGIGYAKTSAQDQKSKILETPDVPLQAGNVAK